MHFFWLTLYMTFINIVQRIFQRKLNFFGHIGRMKMMTVVFKWQQQWLRSLYVTIYSIPDPAVFQSSEFSFVCAIIRNMVIVDISEVAMCVYTDRCLLGLAFYLFLVPVWQNWNTKSVNVLRHSCDFSVYIAHTIITDRCPTWLLHHLFYSCTEISSDLLSLFYCGELVFMR